MAKYNAFIYCTFPAEIEQAFPRFGRIANDDFTRPHISLVYLPGLTAEEIAKAAALTETLAKKIKPFDVDFGKIKSFPPNDGTVAWYVEVSSAELDGLRDNILSVLESLDISVEEKFDEFVPHATLEYLKKGMKFNGKSPKGSCTISEMHFSFKEA